MTERSLLSTCCLVAGACVVAGALIYTAPPVRGAQAQMNSSTPATVLAGMGTPMANGMTCGQGTASTSSTSVYDQRDIIVGNSIWKCKLQPDGVTYNWVAPFNSTPFQNQDWTLQPGLFALAAARSSVYYEVNAVTVQSLTTRTEAGICATAPVLVLLDLGTSPTTTYASATALYSQSLTTGSTVVSNTGLGIAVAAGHYLGVGLSAGVCVTPPTISVVATLQ